MKEIALIGLDGTYRAIVDDEDFEQVSQFRWSVTEYWTRAGKRRLKIHRYLPGNSKQYLTRFLTGFNQARFVNNNPLDCQRANIQPYGGRLASVRGQGPCLKNNTTGYIGVSFENRRGKYIARLKVDGRQHWGGYHLNAVDAAIAYDELAYKHYGSYARFNFPNRQATRDVPPRKRV